MTDYNLRFTNPARTGFVVPDSKTNGPASPNTSAFMTGAVSANTTLQILGHSWPQYGVPVWQDFIYMMEHYANSSPPTYPIPGQMWYNDASGVMSVYNGTSWIPFQSSVVTGDLDMHGFHIINLASPTNAGDAVNLGYLTGNYLSLSGGTVTGSITLSGGSSQINLPNAPSAGANATNKTYVDAQIANLQSQISGYLPLTGGTLTGNLVITSSNLTVGGNTSLGNLLTTGNTILGGSLGVSTTSTFNGAATFNSPVTVTSTTLTITSGGSLNMSNNYINGLPLPLNPDQAASKQYVDSLISSGGGSAIVSGAFSPTNGVLTLTRADSSVITIVGDAAPFVHTHTGDDVILLAASMPGTLLPQQAVIDGSSPNMYLQRAVTILNQVASLAQAQVRRFVATGTGSTLTFIVPFQYISDQNNLQVYVNGVKQVADQRAVASIAFTSQIAAASLLLSGPTTYQVSIATDSGSATNYNVVVPANGWTYIDFVHNMTVGLNGVGVPVTFAIDNNRIIVQSQTSGAGASVTLTAGASNDLLTELIDGGATITNNAVSNTYAYKEATGLAQQVVSSVTFNVAPLLGDTIEIISPPQYGMLNN